VTIVRRAEEAARSLDALQAHYELHPVPLGLAAGLMPSLSDFIGLLTESVRGHHTRFDRSTSATVRKCATLTPFAAASDSFSARLVLGS
jgi:hypothetical protein